jgi:hypothetical protein
MTARRPFASREEVDAYLADDLLECLDCGRRMRFLGGHLPRRHGMTAADYRARWGLPADAPLAGRATRESHAAKARRLIADGRLTPNYAAASETARQAGRDQQVDWLRAEQAARAAVIPHEQLPPGARRADGRDADTAREYQRRRRAAKRST